MLTFYTIVTLLRITFFKTTMLNQLFALKNRHLEIGRNKKKFFFKKFQFINLIVFTISTCLFHWTMGPLPIDARFESSHPLAVVTSAVSATATAGSKGLAGVPGRNADSARKLHSLYRGYTCTAVQ